MKSHTRNLFILILLAVLMFACTTDEYWIPPSSPPSSPPALALLVDENLPLLLNPANPGTALPPAEPASNGVALLNPTDDISTLVSTGTAVEVPESDLPTATPEPQSTPVSTVDKSPFLYYAQAADTLPVIATRFGVQPSEIDSPEPVPETAYLTPGQLLVIPRRLNETTSPQHTMPDSEVVFSPSATDFDVDAFVQRAGGKLSNYTEWLQSTGNNSGAEIIERVAIENSINPRLLLSLLEYQSGWVYGQPADQTASDYPLGYIERFEDGLFNQLVWAVNQLSIGYYAYREGRMTDIRYPDGSSIRLAPELNAGSAALQYYFAQHYSGQVWAQAIDQESGYPALHARMFGDPWERAQGVEPLFPRGISQPPLILPFIRNWTWAYTGGPHGAWERDGAFAALDFAPGNTQSGCVKSLTWVTAPASGLVTRSNNGLVALDLDGDGREQTGWVLILLHVSSDGRVPIGEWVDTGDQIGRPSCEGGISTGTHLHIARKYNGEWIPADGPLPFNLGGWIAHAGPDAYMGTLTRDGETVTACTCANAASQLTRADDDP